MLVKKMIAFVNRHIVNDIDLLSPIWVTPFLIWPIRLGYSITEDQKLLLLSYAFSNSGKTRWHLPLPLSKHAASIYTYEEL